MTHFFDWIGFILIGWFAVSAVATPLIGRMLGRMFSDPLDEENSAISIEHTHHSTGLQPEAVTGTGRKG